MGERRLSKAEYDRLVSQPRRRYQSLSLAEDRWALRGRVPAPAFWFERNDIGAEPNGSYWRRPYIPVVSLVIDGRPAVFFYLTGKRLDSCTFAYNLTPARLGVAVQVMRKAKLARYIRPAAEWALKEVPAYNRAALKPALRRLLRSLKPRGRHP
jgi:hypothetical protein